MGETWIIFVAEPEEPGWENRKLPMGGLTDILDEQWDYTSSGATPQVGDRLRQFLQVEEFIDPKFPGSSTHVRDGDWLVSRIEEYLPSGGESSKKAIILCYCRFEPATSPLEPLSRATPSQRELVGFNSRET